MNGCVACGKEMPEGNHICNDCIKQCVKVTPDSTIMGNLIMRVDMSKKKDLTVKQALIITPFKNVGSLSNISANTGKITTGNLTGVNINANTFNVINMNPFTKRTELTRDYLNECFIDADTDQYTMCQIEEELKELEKLAEIGAATEKAFDIEFTLYCCSDIRRDYEIKSIQELLEVMKEGGRQ